MTKPSKAKRTARRILLSLLSIMLLLALSAALFLILRSPGKTAPYRDPQGNPIPGSVAEIVRMPIGGVEQGMILRGQSDQNPVLLFLHGGPGAPMYPMLHATPAAQLDDLFTVCWWEQRGAGMSYSADIPPESMTMEQLVQDTAEVARYLIDRFGQDKIYLMGASWGTALGAHTAAQYPELFHAYIGIGQMTDQLRSEQLAYDYMVERATADGDSAMLERLAAFTLTDNESLTPDYMQLRAEGLSRYGVGLTHEPANPFVQQILPVLLCREYTLAQKLNYMRGNTFSVEHLWTSTAEDNLFESVPRLEIPIFILHGLHDYIVSYTLAEEYYSAIEAPTKAFYPFVHSAHTPNLEEPEQFHDMIQTHILAPL